MAALSACRAPCAVALRCLFDVPCVLN